MKFTCTKNNFNNGINIALKAVPGKTTMPILECVVIEAQEESIKMTTNDMQLGIETRIPAEVQEEGIILVNAKMIAEIVRRLPDEDVNFEVDENNNILLFLIFFQQVIYFRKLLLGKINNPLPEFLIKF